MSFLFSRAGTNAFKNYLILSVLVTTSFNTVKKDFFSDQFNIKKLWNNL